MTRLRCCTLCEGEGQAPGSYWGSDVCGACDGKGVVVVDPPIVRCAFTGDEMKRCTCADCKTLNGDPVR